MVSSILTRLLSLLAMIGLLIAPLAPPVAMAAVEPAMHMAPMANMSAMPGPMECCPKHKPAAPDCAKGCPWAALCAAQCFSGLTSLAEHHVILSSLPAAIYPGEEQDHDRMAEPPPSRPPRT